MAEVDPQQIRWPDDLASALLSEQDWSRIAKAAGLTPRERQIAEHSLGGRTRDEIGEQLGLGTRTVRQHLETLHSKLRVTNRVGLALRIISLRDQLAQADRRVPQRTHWIG